MMSGALFPNGFKDWEAFWMTRNEDHYAQLNTNSETFLREHAEYPDDLSELYGRLFLHSLSPSTNSTLHLGWALQHCESS